MEKIFDKKKSVEFLKNVAEVPKKNPEQFSYKFLKKF